MYNVKQKGSVLVSILVVMIFLTTLLYALLSYANSNLFRAKSRVYNLQAQYAAESAADQAIAYINNGNESYAGTATDTTLLTIKNLYKATYSVTVAPGATNREKIITATGKVYTPANATTPSFTRKIEVIAERTSSATSTSMLSKNIIEIASSVKNVLAKDVFVNNYIRLNKNTTDFTAENITIADRNTGAGNCSIDGAGNLVKPSSFATPGQTKTIIKMAFNNCIAPPGNSSNIDFDISPNQNNITKVTSTYIPWSQFIDPSYQNAPGGCNDWTSGSSPRDIPSTGNTKKAHYPDASGGVSSSCGSSGDLALGNNQYNIRDHVHLRANICIASACTPTFNNPDINDLKFVFIEGRVNFEQINTASGSGPLVFVIYGPDSGTRTNACPLGDSFYLGKAGSTSTDAPAFYAVANNGACFDGTKFGVTPAFGGISAKNIYIATNSGTPFDLRFNINFPTSQIPIDLSWKAVKYRRL